MLNQQMARCSTSQTGARAFKQETETGGKRERETSVPTTSTTTKNTNIVHTVKMGERKKKVTHVIE